MAITYLAGFVDADGSIFINKYKSGVKKSASYVPVLSISNKNRKVLDWIKETFPYNWTEEQRHFKSDRHNDVWVIRLAGKKASDLLRRLTPHLIVKKEQAILARNLLSLKSMHKNGWYKGERVYDTLAPMYHQIKTKISKLNKGDL